MWKLLDWYYSERCLAAMRIVNEVGRAALLGTMCGTAITILLRAAGL